VSVTGPDPATEISDQTTPRQPAASVAAPRALWVALGVAVSFVPFGVRPWWVGLLGAFAVVAALRAWLGRTVRPIAFAIGLLLPMVAFVGYFVVVPLIRHRLQARAFDAAAWRLANDEKDLSSTGPRSTMIDDLRSSGILEGKTRAEVEGLLGPPLRPYPGETDRLRYLVGWTGGFIDLDPMVLVIHFGPDGRVSKTSAYH